MKQLPAQPNQSLIDGLACLQAIATASEAVGSRELARRLGLEPTRVNRLIKTLAHLGLTAQTEARKYTVGPAIHVLAAQTLFASGLLRRALPVLRGLQSTRCWVALGVLWQDQVSYLCHADPLRPVEEGIGRISLYPATQSSIGMALLAAQPEAAVRQLYRNRDIPRFGRNLPALLRRVREIREKGYALVSDHVDASLAVPIGKAPTAALALSGHRVASDQESCLVELQKVAERLAAEEGKHYEVKSGNL